MKKSQISCTFVIPTKKKGSILMKKIFLPIAILLVLSLAASAQEKKEYKIGTIAFYNLENLFDTIPGANDIEFTPESPKNWNTEKYFSKMERMGSVIVQLGADVTGTAPMIVGVSEVENITPLKDLVNSEAMRPYNYQIVHIDGPDRRGVDCALLYRPDFFQVTNVRMHRIKTKQEGFITRDQIVISGIYDGEEMHFIVLHWPSRLGGEKRSLPRRAETATTTCHIFDSIMKINPNAKIIAMGDLNDDPINESVKKYCNTVPKKNMMGKGTLYNPMEELFKKGIGSLAYGDKWNLFDQMIFSPAFVSNDKSTYVHYQSHVFNKAFLTQKEGRFKGYPLRTYVGTTYQGGYSDHFPVYSFIIKEK